jgi:ABC-type glycerol-3-phosphate transport system substrate-binding protein
MKKLIYTFALFGLVVMAACSGDSPGSRDDVPPVVADEWVIVSLSVSDPNPDIGVAIFLDAYVQKNGADAPNGTTVEFRASGGEFVSGTTEASVTP